MTFTFREATRENVALLIALAGGTGSGKTFTAMRLASGIAGDKRFCVIDTEAGRAKHYADQFKFDHGDLGPPFTPERYTEAIVAADAAGYPVIVVDSASHEHAGDGGLLDWHEAELQRMAGDDWKKRDACTMAAWIKPKKSHKKYVSRLLQLRAHLILCFRAEEKVEMTRGDDGKMKVTPKKSLTGKDGWIPICEKSLPFEATCSFLLLASAPGVPQPIKLQEQHRALFPLDVPITEAAGRAITAWAAGGTPRAPVVESQVEPAIASEQITTLKKLCAERGVTIARLCRAGKVDTLEELLAADYESAEAWVLKHPKVAEPDEAAILRKLDGAKDRDAAAVILDSVRAQAWFPKAEEAYRNRWTN